tara:strand:+ start:1518 stop:1973 length:456 start_codon:yes stop_codon:yes gene_type:complete
MNNWMMHLKKFHKDHPELSYKECMSKAKKTYKKTGSKPGKTIKKKRGKKTRGKKMKGGYGCSGPALQNGGKKRRKKSAKKSAKKGKFFYKSPSKTRKGRLDFVTHKGDKVFHKGRHFQKKMRAPYKKFPTKKKLVLVMPATPPANPFSLMN